MPRRRRGITSNGSLNSSSEPSSDYYRPNKSSDRCGGGHKTNKAPSSCSVGSRVTQDCSISSTTTPILSQNSMHDFSRFSMLANLQLNSLDSEIDVDRKNILTHPLYPLLAILFQQCELASARPSSPPALDSFDSDLKTFIDRHQQIKMDEGEYEDDPLTSTILRETLSPNATPTSLLEGKTTRGRTTSVRTSSVAKASPNCTSDAKTMNKSDPSSSVEQKLRFLAGDTELDELIVKAIQVLRIHLLELHKVNELCKDFCSRYIHSLKTKFQTDPMIQDSQPSSPADSEAHSPIAPGCYGQGYMNHDQLNARLSCRTPNDMMIHQDYRCMDEDGYLAGGMSPSLFASSSGDFGGDAARSFGRSLDGCYTPNCSGDYASSPKLDGRCPPFLHQSSGYPHHSTAAAVMLNGSFNASHLDNICIDGGGKQKRGVLPKRATQIMKQWLFQHLVHPYPTEDEKRQIAGQTNLTLLQVNNWFINARRRILQPMLDASNFVPLGNSSSTCSTGRDSASHDELKSSSSQRSSNQVVVVNKKKKAATSRPSNNRFWPASLAAAAAIHPIAAGLATSTSSSSTATSSTNSNSQVWKRNNSTASGKEEQSRDQITSAEDSRVEQEFASNNGSHSLIPPGMSANSHNMGSDARRYNDFVDNWLSSSACHEMPPPHPPMSIQDPAIYTTPSNHQHHQQSSNGEVKHSSSFSESLNGRHQDAIVESNNSKRSNRTIDSCYQLDRYRPVSIFDPGNQSRDYKTRQSSSDDLSANIHLTDTTHNAQLSSNFNQFPGNILAQNRPNMNHDLLQGSRSTEMDSDTSTIKPFNISPIYPNTQSYIPNSNFTTGSLSSSTSNLFHSHNNYSAMLLSQAQCYSNYLASNSAGITSEQMPTSSTNDTVVPRKSLLQCRQNDQAMGSELTSGNHDPDRSNLTIGYAKNDPENSATGTTHSSESQFSQKLPNDINSLSDQNGPNVNFTNGNTSTLPPNQHSSSENHRLNATNFDYHNKTPFYPPMTAYQPSRLNFEQEDRSGHTYYQQLHYQHDQAAHSKQSTDWKQEFEPNSWFNGGYSLSTSVNSNVLNHSMSCFDVKQPSGP